MTVGLKLFVAALRRMSSRLRARIARQGARLAQGAIKLLAGGVPGKLGYRLCQLAVGMAMAAGIAANVTPPVQAIFGTSQISRDSTNATFPAVAKDTDGDAVIVWYGPDSDSQGIFMRRLNSYNQNASAIVPVTQNQAGNQYTPDVAIDADGDFVVVWAGYGYTASSSSSSQYDDSGVFCQRFDANGVKAGPQFRVNTTTTYYQGLPAVAMDAAGNFTVVWESDITGASTDFDVIGRRFAADGTPLSGEFTVNQQTTSAEYAADIAMDLNGDFVVAWQSNGPSLGYSSSLYYSGWEVYAQRFDNTGAAQGNNFRVNTSGTDDQVFPAVSMDADGDFVVAWTTDASFFSRWVSFATFNADGTANSGETSAQDTSPDRAQAVAVDMDDDGNFLVAWEAYEASISDCAVQAHFFNFDGTENGNEFNVEGYQTFFVGAPAVALDSDGDFIIAYQDDPGSYFEIQASFGYLSSSFASTGASPRVGNVFVSNSHSPIEEGSRLAQDNITTLTVTFSEDMDKASVENTGNWDLTRGGTPVAISSVLSKFNLQRNRNEAVIHLVSPLGDGNYTLTLSDAVVDENDGAQLDGDNDGAATGDFVLNFMVNGAERSGGETRVNTVTTDDQLWPDVAMDADGNYVVVWQSYRYDAGPGSSTFDILAQRYSATGAPQGPVITVNDVASGDQTRPTVAMDADGDFVVAWQADDYFISLQLFEADGTPYLSNYNVTANFNGVRRADVAMDADGDFVVVWNSNYSSQYSGPSSMAPGEYYDWDIVGATFDRFGNNTGGGILNNNTRTHDQTMPAVAMDADGDLIAVWMDESVSFYIPGPAIMGLRVDRHGNPLEGLFGFPGEFPVTLPSLPGPFGGFTGLPDVAMDADGDYVVAWTKIEYTYSYYPSFGPPFKTSIEAARFNSNGLPLGSFFGGDKVNTDGRNAVDPAISMDADGDYVITWIGNDGVLYASGSSAVYPLNGQVYSRRFNSAGEAQEVDVRVNTYASGIRLAPATAMDSDGDYVVVWISGPSPYSSSASQDGDDFGVYMQRFNENAAPTTSGIPDLVMDEDDDPVAINLAPFFADAEDSDAALTYEIVANTNPALVAAAVSGSNIGIALFENQNGTADITIRVTDTGGLWVEDTFTVTVNDVGEPVADNGGGDDDDGCVAATSSTAPWGLLAVLLAVLGSLRGFVRRKA